MSDLEPALGADARVESRDVPDPSFWPESRRPERRRPAWPVALLCLLVVAAGVWAVAGSYWLEPELSTNLDEQAYLHQADLLAHGHLSVSVPSAQLARSFQPWFAAATDHGYIFKYNLVWPAVLAATTAVSAPRVALALSVALFLVGTYALAAVLLRSRAKAVLAAAVVALSPLTLIQSTTLLSYVLFGGLWTFAAAALVRGITRPSRWSLAGAGAMGAIAFCARPYDAILVLAPFCLWAVWALRRDLHALVVAVGCAAIAAAPIVVAQAFYNRYVTGSFLKLPYSLWSSTDRLGFGDRGLLPSGVPQVHFGPRQGVHAVAVNLWALHSWAFGGVVLAVLAVVGVCAQWRRPGAVPLAAVAVVVPAGYLFFWGIANISLLSKAIDRFGPYYFVPVLVPLAVFGVEGAALVWAWRRWVLVALTAIALVTTGFGMADAVAAALGERDARTQPYDVLTSITRGPGHALVFLPGDYIGTSVLNRYTLDASTTTHDVYAVDDDNRAIALVQSRPEDTPYRLAACDYTAETPLGSHQYPRTAAPSEALVTGSGARAQRLHLVTTGSSGLTLRATVAPGATTGGTVDVAAGTYRASAPLQPAATGQPATVAVHLDPTGLTLSGDVGTVATTSGPDAPLTIRTVSRDPAGAPAVSRSWTAPVAVTPTEVTVLTPGSTATSADFPTVPEAEICHADPALSVQVAAR
jgi:hypothetical protein